MLWQKGRGATENPQSRYLSVITEPVDDGWHVASAEARDRPSRPASDATSSADTEPTTLHADRTVKIITRNQSPDIPFDRSINPFKGCEHGCIYCFARPTHAYLDLSPGLDFETQIFYKTSVRDRLISELSAKGYKCRPIAMGTNTDPYQPAEKALRITRTILETLLEVKHPVSLVTKSRLVLRDVDILQEMARQQLVSVAVSLTTLSNELKTRLEPRTAGPAARLRAIEQLSAAGVPVGAMVAPVIPFLNDHEIEAIVAAGARAGCGTMSYILLRLPLEVKDLFRAWLKVHYPLKAERVMSAMKSAHGGREYDARWGERMRGSGSIADLIEKRFLSALKCNGIGAARQPELRCDLFSPPGPQQLTLI